MPFYFMAVKPWLTDMKKVACIEIAGSRKGGKTMDLSDVKSVNDLMHKPAMRIKSISIKYAKNVKEGTNVLRGGNIQKTKEQLLMGGHKDETLGETLERLKQEKRAKRRAVAEYKRSLNMSSANSVATWSTTSSNRGTYHRTPRRHKRSVASSSVSCSLSSRSSNCTLDSMLSRPNETLGETLKRIKQEKKAERAALLKYRRGSAIPTRPLAPEEMPMIQVQIPTTNQQTHQEELQSVGMASRGSFEQHSTAMGDSSIGLSSEEDRYYDNNNRDSSGDAGILPVPDTLLLSYQEGEEETKEEIKQHFPTLDTEWIGDEDPYNQIMVDDLMEADPDDPSTWRQEEEGKKQQAPIRKNSAVSEDSVLLPDAGGGSPQAKNSIQKESEPLHQEIQEDDPQRPIRKYSIDSTVDVDEICMPTIKEEAGKDPVINTGEPLLGQGTSDSTQTPRHEGENKPLHNGVAVGSPFACKEQPILHKDSGSEKTVEQSNTVDIDAFEEQSMHGRSLASTQHSVDTDEYEEELLLHTRSTSRRQLMQKGRAVSTQSILSVDTDDIYEDPFAHEKQFTPGHSKYHTDSDDIYEDPFADDVDSLAEETNDTDDDIRFSHATDATTTVEFTDSSAENEPHFQTDWYPRQQPSLPTAKSSMKVKTLQESLMKAEWVDPPARQSSTERFALRIARKRSVDSDCSVSNSNGSLSRCSEGEEDELIDLFREEVLGLSRINQTRTRRLEWGNVEIREYEICLGDNPACAEGPPIQLDWKFETAAICFIEVYEQYKIEYKGIDRHPRRLSSRSREDRLLKMGYTPQQLKVAASLIARDQKHRISTVSRLKYMKFDSKMEKIARIFPT